MLRAIVAATSIATIALTYAPPAHASVAAFLVSCEGTTSVTGKYVYVGIYDYAGKHFKRTFATYCPSKIDIE